VAQAVPRAFYYDGVAIRNLLDIDKKILAKNAAQAPAWTRATLLSIAGLGTGDHLG
jgi:hypothetical protein